METLINAGRSNIGRVHCVARFRIIKESFTTFKFQMSSSLEQREFPVLFEQLS